MAVSSHAPLFLTTLRPPALHVPERGDSDGWAAKNGTCKAKSAGNGGVYDLPEGYRIALEICLVSDDQPDGTYCDELNTYNIN